MSYEIPRCSVCHCMTCNCTCNVWCEHCQDYHKLSIEPYFEPIDPHAVAQNLENGHTSQMKHRWKSQQLGGSPDEPTSYEWVTYCDMCGDELNEDNRNGECVDPQMTPDGRWICG